MALNKPRHVIAFIVVLLGVATLFVFKTDTPAGTQTTAMSRPEQVSGGATSPTATPAPATRTKTAEEIDDIQMIAGYFKQQYEQRIKNPYWQLKMLEKLMLLLKEKYPDDWEQKLREILQEAFPDLAEMLLKKLTFLNEYASWLENLKGNVTFTDPGERRRALWDKRVALFGEEAYVIWEAQYKDEQFSDKLATIDQSTQAFSEKSQQYIDSLKAVFGPQALASGHTTQKMGRFLELSSVQAELAQMPKQQRRTELRAFRSAMGLEPEALDRWEALDAERDTIRASGGTYMQQRAAIEGQYKGEVLQQKITELQERIFGPVEAKYIRNEESTGYYRYNSPQKIGFN